MVAAWVNPEPARYVLAYKKNPIDRSAPTLRCRNGLKLNRRIVGHYRQKILLTMYATTISPKTTPATVSLIFSFRASSSACCSAARIRCSSRAARALAGLTAAGSSGCLSGSLSAAAARLVGRLAFPASVPDSEAFAGEGGREGVEPARGSRISGSSGMSSGIVSRSSPTRFPHAWTTHRRRTNGRGAGKGRKGGERRGTLRQGRKPARRCRVRRAWKVSQRRTGSKKHLSPSVGHRERAKL